MDRRQSKWISAVRIDRCDGRAPLNRCCREGRAQRVVVQRYRGDHVPALWGDGVRVVDMGRWLLEPLEGFTDHCSCAGRRACHAC